MTKQTFQLKLNSKVLPAGLFVDKEFNFLAYSSDELIGDQDLVEIKNLTFLEGVEQQKKKLNARWPTIVASCNYNIYYYQV